MARMLIVLVLALGPAAALATPTLELGGSEFRGWKGIEVTVFQSDRPAAPAPIRATTATPFPSIRDGAPAIFSAAAATARRSRAN